MRFRDRIKFYTQRRICKKIQHCIEIITRLEPTVDGSFYSPIQVCALRQLHFLCEEIGCPKSAFLTNNVIGPRYYTEDFPRFFDNVDNEDYRKLGLEALVKSRRISAEVHNPEGVAFFDVQRPEGFKEDKPIEA